MDMDLSKTQKKIRALYDKHAAKQGWPVHGEIPVPDDVKESKARADINVSPDEQPEMLGAEAHHKYKFMKEKLATHGGTKTHYGAGIAAAVEAKEAKVDKAKGAGAVEKFKKCAGKEGTAKAMSDWADLQKGNAKISATPKPSKMKDDEAAELVRAEIRNQVRYNLMSWIDSDYKVPEYKITEKRLGLSTALQCICDHILSEAGSQWRGPNMLQGIRALGGVEKLLDVVKAEFGKIKAFAETEKAIPAPTTNVEVGYYG